MMKNLIPFLFILFLLACSKDKSAALNKCWSLAERGEDFQVYYPCGDERITPSRFSPTYKFYANDSCEYLVTSPNDGHYFKDGIYEYNLKTSIIIIKSLEEDELIAKFKVLELKEDELKLNLIE